MYKLLSRAIILLVVLASPARAEFVNEFRFGGTISNPSFLESSHTEKDQFSLNVELLTRKLELDSRADPSDGFASRVLHHFLTPRLHIGALANLDKNGTNAAYAGLTWHHDFNDKFFYESSFGGAITNGSIKPSATRAGLGSKVLFRESVALGINLSETTNLLFQLEHYSHAELAGKYNRGITNASVKLGFKF